MSRNFYYSGVDAAIVSGSANFASLIATGYASYGLTTGQATAFGTLNTALQSAYSAAVEPTTRTRVTIAAKSQAVVNMRANAILLAKVIYATATVTNSQLLALGLLPRSSRTPVPPPADRPALDIVSVTGRVVKCRVHSPTSDRRGKPRGVALAFIYSFVGTTPPTDVSLFRIEGTATRTQFEVTFPSSVPGGSQVWLAAAWANARTLTGPACAAVTVYLQGAAAA